MEMEFVDFDSYDPEKWSRVYRLGELHPWTYFTGLIGCAQTASIEGILKTIPEEMKLPFKEYVLEMSHVKNDEDIMSIGRKTPVFGVAEVQKFVQWFSGQASPVLDHRDAEPK